VLKFARQRLLDTTNPRVLPDAACQQGLMQITRDFCYHSDALCAVRQSPQGHLKIARRFNAGKSSKFPKPRRDGRKDTPLNITNGNCGREIQPSRWDWDWPHQDPALKRRTIIVVSLRDHHLLTL
jgi:hypothetical protein